MVNPTSLSCNLHHLRSVQIIMYWSSENYLENLTPPNTVTSGTVSHTGTPINKMTNLQRFMLRGYDCNHFDSLRHDHDILNSMMEILSTNHRLTHIKIEVTLDLLSSHIEERLLEALRQDLPLLQHLFLSNNDTYKSDSVAQATKFLNVCFQHPQLIHLEYRALDHRWYDKPTPDSIAKAHFESLLNVLEHTFRTNASSEIVPGCRLKSLALPHVETGYPESFLIPLLKTHLPELERFDVPILDGPYEDSLEKVVSGYCSKLKHLSGFLENQYRNANATIAVIRGCAKWGGLESFEMAYHDYYEETVDPGHKLIETLMKYHSTTLEEVHIQSNACDMLWNPILTGCPNLKSFRLLPLGTNTRVGVGFSDFTRDTWAVRNLKELRIHLFQRHYYADMKEVAVQEANALGEILKQIGRLTQLEVLDLAYVHSKYYDWAIDFSLERKWFMGLSELKQLRCVSMPNSFWMREANQSCMEFMDTNWPRLEEILLRNSDYVGNERHKFFQSDHWQWLRRRKPDLKFVFRSYNE